MKTDAIALDRLLVLLLGNAVWISWHEEPGLEGRFGEEYKEYRRNVPRWIPRVKGWQRDEEEPR